LLAAEDADFTHRIEKAAIWSDRQEGRTDHLGRQLRFAQLAARQVQFQSIDPLAGASRVGTDVDPQFLRFGVLRGASGRQRPNAESAKKEKQGPEKPTRGGDSSEGHHSTSRGKRQSAGEHTLLS